VVNTYAGGMRSQSEQAISLITAPPIIVLEELTTGRDPRSRLAIWESIRELIAAGATILYATQYLDEADQLADRIAVIDGGVVIAEGTADELKNRVGKERLELVLATDKDFKAAQKLLDGDSLHHDASRRTLSTPIDGGAKHVKEILDQMEQAHITIEGLSLHKPTLDDVFLGLTGHQAIKEAHEYEEGK